MLARGAARRSLVAAAACAVACLACTGDEGSGPGSAGAGNAPPVTGEGACRGIELPDGRHFVAEGLCVRAIAVDQGQLRQLTFASNGDLLAVTSNGEIRRYRDLDDDGTFLGAGEREVLGSTGGGNGNNAHLDEESGFLYAGTPDGVGRFGYSADLDDLGAAQPVVVGQPSSGTHTLHTVHVYDGYLYVHSGSENNAVAPLSPEYDTERSVLKRFALEAFDASAPFEWSAGEVVVIGLRNMVGFTQNAAGRMYGVVNGIDDLMYQGKDIHLDNPGEDLIRIEPGARHGYPYCFTAANVTDASGELVAAGTRLLSATNPEARGPAFTNPNSQEWCDEHTDPPETFLPAHSAPLDLVFFDGSSDSLPERWRGGAFVSLHGSWNTEPSVGHQVVFVAFDEDGQAEMPEATPTGASFPHEVVFGGGSNGEPADGAWGWTNGSAGEDPVRPVGVAISPVDGALYVSSDNNGPTKRGALYRIALRND
jgi:glucose/arabinose dehydrogenase